MGELNFIYFLIYLDDLIMFLRTAKEHLHRLCVVFNHPREYNLKLKSLKCSPLLRGDKLSGSQGIEGRCSAQQHQCEGHC